MSSKVEIRRSGRLMDAKLTADPLQDTSSTAILLTHGKASAAYIPLSATLATKRPRQNSGSGLMLVQGPATICLDAAKESQCHDSACDSFHTQTKGTKIDCTTQQTMDRHDRPRKKGQRVSPLVERMNVLKDRYERMCKALVDNECRTIDEMMAEIKSGRCAELLKVVELLHASRQEKLEIAREKYAQRKAQADREWHAHRLSAHQDFVKQRADYRMDLTQSISKRTFQLQREHAELNATLSGTKLSEDLLYLERAKGLIMGEPQAATRTELDEDLLLMNIGCHASPSQADAQALAAAPILANMPMQQTWEQLQHCDNPLEISSSGEGSDIDEPVPPSPKPVSSTTASHQVIQPNRLPGIRDIIHQQDQHPIAHWSEPPQAIFQPAEPATFAHAPIHDAGAAKRVSSKRKSTTQSRSHARQTSQSHQPLLAPRPAPPPPSFTTQATHAPRACQSHPPTTFAGQSNASVYKYNQWLPQQGHGSSNAQDLSHLDGATHHHQHRQPADTPSHHDALGSLRHPSHFAGPMGHTFSASDDQKGAYTSHPSAPFAATDASRGPLWPSQDLLVGSERAGGVMHTNFLHPFRNGGEMHGQLAARPPPPPPPPQPSLGHSNHAPPPTHHHEQTHSAAAHQDRGYLEAHDASLWSRRYRDR